MTFKIIVLLFTISVLNQGTLFGQWECYFTLDPEEATLQNGEGCDLWENYAPYPDMDMVPIKYIRIAYHVLQDENGENNLDDLDGKVFIYKIKNNANSKLGNLAEPELDEPYEWPPVTSPWITDSRIRFIIDTIYYHQDDEGLWDWSDCGLSNVGPKAFDAYEKYVVNNIALNTKQKDSTLHIILGGGSCEHVGGHVLGGGPYKSRYIAQNGVLHAYNNEIPNHWVPAGNLVHEFGHVAGLDHNFHGGEHGTRCDDCYDNDPEGLPCPIEGTSNNYMDYGSGSSFSQCQIGKMHYYLSGYVDHVGGFAINNDCTIIGEPFTIEDGRNVVWMHNNTMAGNLIIEPGATLTIMCTIKMKEGAKIVVKRGGKLIVDEGTITSACSGLWRGIEVWGNSQLSHSPPIDQGMVFVKNGGVIENAITGVKTYRPISDYIDDCVYGYTGGIIVADNAVFRNNRVAVEFLPYNFDKNLSSFKNTEFITDSELHGGFFPDYFVKLSGVRNIDFKGCTFTNTLPGAAYDPDRGSGIFAIDADVQILSLCTYPYALPVGEPCPEEYVQPSEFNSLYYGVYAANTGLNRKVKIDQAVFNQNYRGIMNLGHNFAAITRNEFQVFHEIVHDDPETWGLRMEDAEGFMIEENHFKGVFKHGYGRVGTGLVIQNSGPEPNMVYNNTFETLEFATIARGENRNRTNNEGLCYKCNDFMNNKTDIRVYSENPNLASEGIAGHQGAEVPNDNTAPAGNTFTDPPTFYILNNGTSNRIFYFRHWSTTTPDVHLSPIPFNGPVTISSVSETNYSKNGSCPSNLGGSEPPVEKLNMMVAGQQADTVYATLELLVDDGDTEAMNDDVLTTTPITTENTYYQLLQLSPYLSDTVLKTTVLKEDVFTTSIIRDVMVANPQSGKSEDILDMLEAKFDPMPESMMADIYDGRLIVGGREILEAELAHWRRERYKAFTNLYRWYSADTSCIYATDSLIALLNAENNAANQYKLAFLYLDRNEPLQAGQTLAAIPASFGLDANALAVHQAYLDLADIWLQIFNDSVYFINPGEDIVSNLLVLYNAGLGLPSIYARNILLASGLVEYNPDVTLTEPLKSERFYRRDVSVQEDAIPYLKLYPNPSSGTLTIEYLVDERAKYAGIVFTDMQGVSQKSESLSLSGGVKHLSVKDLKPGVYMVSLFFDNKRVVVQRLTIAY